MPLMLVADRREKEEDSQAYQLADIWKLAQRKGKRHVVIQGEAGMGKTTVCHHIMANQAHAHTT